MRDGPRRNGSHISRRSKRLDGISSRYGLHGRESVSESSRQASMRTLSRQTVENVILPCSFFSPRFCSLLSRLR